ncbi:MULTISPECIES: preprotein translocase subunit SecG [unclassified Campylobacter]|uniref:preprotein translocase subunit SecG n=1 Tax=unclassified Campylobacter TaxID=2593542 RepID=UPI001237E71F|nr:MULTISPECIES: preprotein translocase subunit SecG [unclassified Campylobacter]KAA6225068.1 preprotein translocase subunit SecG [Campylobacter sp. LR196d]KAA6226081.1 preprotein translocase subunit SecG [Campylobacter sp. LR185c]KAA6228027.1 preprotein translocase subunit SecG [Campylobacter sp. LR286c]KAA6231282.1 preprotein translocase subunit SecG [Campylobacter sp. LR264d]KAA6231493.1 preprotein translocase subunit SecG [Campylobacter sp. LR291e]
MITLLIVLQFVIVVIICIAVLLQKSSSIGLGAYSGSNESLFGAKGPAGFLAKFTFIMGLVLIANTIGLGYLYNKASKNSLAEKIQIETNSSIPVVPSAPLSIPELPSSNLAPLAPNIETNSTKE